MFSGIDSMQKIILFRFMRFSERSETDNPANEHLFDFVIIFQVIPNKRVEYPILALLGWLKILGSCLW